MSRIAKETIAVPQGLDVVIDGQKVVVKSSKGQLELQVHPKVTVSVDQGVLKVAQKDDSVEANMQSGTTRALLNNMVTGLHQGFVRELKLVGVGYKAQAKGRTLALTLGFSHPVEFALPEGITAETPEQEKIVLRGADKNLLGQVAANIRKFRSPEPYKGKGIRYADETVRIKEAKKK